MPIPQSDANKRDAARGSVTGPGYLDGLITAYAAISTTSYADKNDALDALDDLWFAYDNALTVIEALS